MLVCSGLSRLVAARRRLSSPNRCGDARAYCCCTRALHRGGVASQMHHQNAMLQGKQDERDGEWIG